MKRLFILLFSISGFTINLFSQTDVEPTYLSEKKYLKKQKGKYGLYDKAEKKWITEPVYDKITSVAFSPKLYDYEMGDGSRTVYYNLMFYKLWKGDIFDLLYVSDDKKNIYKKNFELWVTDISEVVFPAFKPAAGSPYISKDFVNFIYYKKNGKWGWFVNEYYYGENILHAPVFDNIPVARYSYFNSFHEYFHDYIVATDSAGITALYTLRNNQLILPGNYKNIVINDQGFIITENENGLKGYNRVAPQFKSVERTVFKSYVDRVHFLVILPDNTRRVMQEDGKILTEQEVIQESKINKEIAAFANFINTTKTVAGNIEISIKPDNSGVITKMDDKEVNIPFEIGEYLTDKKTFSVKINGEWKKYYNLNNKAVEYNYTIRSDEQSFLWPTLAKWPDDDTEVPVALVTKGNKLFMVNCLNDKRKELPFTLTNDNKGVDYNGTYFEWSTFYQYDYIKFKRDIVFNCSYCTKGYVTEEKEVITKAHKEYETVKVTGYKNETESVWNPNTNSYQYVTSPKQVSSYEQVAIDVPEKREIEEVSVKCKYCNGNYHKVDKLTLIWNGKEFVLE